MKPFDANGAFRSAASESGALRRLAVRGAGATVLSGGLGQAIQIIATVVLARLLTPADFGVVAMVGTFSLLFSNFGVNGFTEAVLQREEIDHSLASNLFWINLAAGLLLTGGFAAAGPLVARLFSNPHAIPVAAGMSATIFISSTSVLHVALLQRAMRFSLVCADQIVARAVSVATSILLAWAGWGYWALVAGAVAQSLSASLGAFILCRWVPSLPRRVAGTASMVRFGMHVYGRFCVNYGSRNIDNVLVGWRFNAPALGFYKKAYDLFALSGGLLVSSLTTVAVSAMSRLSRDPIRYKRCLLSILAVTAFVGMGIGADLTLVGKDVIRLLLGPRWGESGRIFTFFGPGIGIMLLYGTHGWIHLSIGKPDRWLRWGLLEFALTTLLFVVALPWGPEGIALAWTASFWILTVPALRYAAKPIGLDTRSMIAVVWRYPFASLLAGAASILIMRQSPSSFMAATAIGAFLRILTVTALFGVLYLGTVVALHRGFQPFYLIAGLIREMLPNQPNGVCYPRGTLTSETDGEILSGPVSPQPLAFIPAALEIHADDDNLWVGSRQTKSIVASEAPLLGGVDSKRDPV